MPLYLQIYEQIREQIVSGIIPEGSRLVSTRNLAKTMQISRNTVESAYQQLCSEGYVCSKACSGYLVQKIDSILYNELTEQNQEAKRNRLKTVHDQGRTNKWKYNFQYGHLNFDDFPFKIWKSLTNQVFLSNSAENITAYNERKGELELRIEIMNYLNNSRGVICQPDQIVICAGTQSCLSILCQLLRKYSTDMAVEEPTYDGARDVFVNNGYNVTAVDLDDNGISLEKLEQTNVKILYVTPSHQYPMGDVMPINKRLNLLDWAEKNNAVIIEDDYDSEFRYNSRPIPSLHNRDTKDRIIYISTFSKSLAPGLRMSFMVLPPKWLEIYNKDFAKYNCPVPILEQQVLCRFMNEGHWYKYLRKIYLSNKKKHDTLLRTINDLMGSKVKIHGKNAGLHIVLEFNNGMTESQLIELAKAAGVTVYPMSRYWLNQEKYTNNMILLGFSGLSESHIIEGLNILNRVWFKE